jgi:hypothetical protein
VNSRFKRLQEGSLERLDDIGIDASNSEVIYLPDRQKTCNGKLQEN